MGLVTCRDCSKEHSDSAVACPFCGARPKKSRAGLAVILGAIAIFIAFGLTAKKSPSILDQVSPDKAAAPGASADMQRLVDHSKVDQCWQDAAHAPVKTVQDLEAGCRILEKEFVRKHNTPF